MAEKLSKTKELVAIDNYNVEATTPRKSKLPVIPFSTLLPDMGSILELHSHTDDILKRLEELEGDNSKEFSMLQQVTTWLKMGEE